MLSSAVEGIWGEGHDTALQFNFVRQAITELERKAHVLGVTQIAELRPHVQRHIVLVQHAWQHRVEKLGHPQHAFTYAIARGPRFGAEDIARQRQEGGSDQDARVGLSLEVGHEDH